uniref:Putative secreted protein n=1 Tax=Rhipicephalus microplus TaxID=6941 RepID=A0A6M2DDC7_RHIMP
MFCFFFFFFCYMTEQNFANGTGYVASMARREPDSTINLLHLELSAAFKFCCVYFILSLREPTGRKSIYHARNLNLTCVHGAIL